MGVVRSFLTLGFLLLLGVSGCAATGADESCVDVGEPPGEVQRVFVEMPRTIKPVECAEDADCAGQRCVKLTKQLGVCEEPFPPEPTECSSQATDGSAEECGCLGRTCGTGQVCRAIERTCSCAPVVLNQCVERPCEASTDCGPDSVCLPNQFVLGARCLDASACKADEDCTRGARGRCSLRLYPALQQGEVSVRPLECVYEFADGDSPKCGSDASWFSASDRYYYTYAE